MRMKLESRNWVRHRVVLPPVRAAESGRYQLLKRYPTGIHTSMVEVAYDNMDVCRAYEKNLNSFPEIKHPMVCERPINPALKEFNTLQWAELMVSEHRDTVLKIDKQSSFYRANPSAMKIEEWEEQFKRTIAQGLIRLRLAKIQVTEINGNCLDAPLYILEYGSASKCNPMSQTSLDYSGGYKYFITDHHMDNLVKIGGSAWFGELSGPFVYKNKVYFTSFGYTDWSDWFKRRLKLTQYEVRLYVLYQPHVGAFAAAPICRFKYIGTIPVIPSKESMTIGSPVYGVLAKATENKSIQRTRLRCAGESRNRGKLYVAICFPF